MLTCGTRTYFVGANPDPLFQNPISVCQNGFHAGWDHTFGNNQGRYLYVDGSTSTNDIVWRQTFNGLMSGLSYNFRFWANNIVKTIYNFTDPRLEVKINNITVLTTPPIPETPDAWLIYNYNWIANSTTAVIDIRQATPWSGAGTDFGIDDITFRGRCNGNASDILIEPSACSCDPNDKLVSPKGCGAEGNIDLNTDLEYIIRFENIGTGNAHNILIRDILDTNLDIKSFEMLGSSHPISQVEFFPNNVVFFIFENIELPPVITNPNQCTGYVKFKINPKKPTLEGTKIINKAEIYFDDNPAVVTNITTNTYRNKPYPSASFSYNKSCSSLKTLDFSYNGQTPDGATFYWDFGSDAIPSFSNSESPQNILFNNSGTHYVTLTVTRFGCSQMVSDTLSVFDYNCGKNKTLVCHQGKVICISNNALSLHLAHGDCIGTCENSSHNKLTQSDDIEYYYDQSNNSLFIDDDKNSYILEIYDQTGRLVSEIKINTIQNNKINLGNLSSGIYYGLLKSGNSQSSIKIVKL